MHYTRKADMIVSDEYTSLGKELRARAAINNGIKPDFFISVHHNSTADKTHDEIEMYYKLFTEGPARELAFMVADEFQNLYPGMDSEIVAGNFSVVRNSEVESLLLECAYLSQKAGSRDLIALPILKKEAEAIYQAILRYSKKGHPFIEITSDTTSTVLIVTDKIPLRYFSAKLVHKGEVVYQSEIELNSMEHKISSDRMEYDQVFIEAVNEKGRKAAYVRDLRSRTNTDTRPEFLVILPASIPEEPNMVKGYQTARYRVRFARAWDDSVETLRWIEQERPKYCVVFQTGNNPRLAHYWRSRTGTALAAAMAPSFGLRQTGESHYFLNHTSMGALVIETEKGKADIYDKLYEGIERFMESNG